MAAWFTALIPFIPEVIKLARPLFTRARPQDKVPDVVEKQIVELQEVATQNTEAIKALAESTARELQFARRLAAAALAAAILALCLAGYAIFVKA